MRAIFFTTETADAYNHVLAWESVYGEPHWYTHDHRGLRNDWQMVEAVKLHKPDIAFYIGAVEGRGVPKVSALAEVNSLVPLVNLCSDAQDKPWVRAFIGFKTHNCFTLTAAIDGANTADLATLTPVDARPFTEMRKTIRLGFSGSAQGYNRRSEVIRAVDWFGKIELRKRGGSYKDHVDFMCKCQMLLNTPWTGSGNGAHMKGRILEAGFARAAVMEHVDSPIGDWFPKGAWFPWKTPKDIVEMEHDLTDDEISESARILYEVVKSKYTAKHIYQEILNHVDIA